MATLSDYTLPANIRWNKTGTDLLQVSTGGEGGTLVAWTSQYSTFQVQYRTRERYSLAALALMGSDLRDVWTTWSAWTDPESAVTNDTASTTAKNGQVITYTGHPFAYTYDWTTYDARELEVRVRVFISTTLTCSEWAYQLLRIAYRPTVTATAAREADGSISVQVTSDWVRSGSTLSVSDPRRWSTYGGGSPSLGWLPSERWGGITKLLTDDTGDTYFSVPGNLEQSNNYVYFADFSFITGDGAEGITTALLYPSSRMTVYQVAVTGHTNPPGVDVPTITATEDAHGNLAVTVTGNYDTAAAWYTWTDARGNTQQQQIGLAASGANTWAGLIEAPPYDVTITINAAGTKTGQWASDTTTATVDSHGAVTLQHTASDERVSILYNARDTVKRKFDNEVALFKPAGSSRSKSRYGEGGRMGLSVSGISPDVTETATGLECAGVAAFAELETWGDWILRIPGGERYAVALKSYALENAAAPGYFNLGLELEVVS